MSNQSYQPPCPLELVDVVVAVDKTVEDEWTERSGFLVLVAVEKDDGGVGDTDQVLILVFVVVAGATR